jgi:GntR family transcriptional regulator/MocR family aminotransferase
MAQVVNIYRYPVKGLSAEALRRAQLEAEKPFPHDRVFALARPSAPIDSINPQWAKKGLFAMLMLDEGLARVTTELDLSDLRLTVRRKGQVAISGRLDVEDDRRALEAFFWTLLPNFLAPPVLLRSRGGHFMDKPDNVSRLSTSPRCAHSKSPGARLSTRYVFAPTFTLTAPGPGKSSTGSAATYGSAA